MAINVISTKLYDEIAETSKKNTSKEISKINNVFFKITYFLLLLEQSHPSFMWMWKPCNKDLPQNIVISDLGIAKVKSFFENSEKNSLIFEFSNFLVTIIVTRPVQKAVRNVASKCKWFSGWVWQKSYVMYTTLEMLLKMLIQVACQTNL